MNLEQIFISTIIGGVIGFLATVAAPQVRMRRVEAILFGILGAFAGSSLVRQLLPGAAPTVIWLAPFIGATISIILFATAKMKWHWTRILRQRQIWSFVQPFEE